MPKGFLTEAMLKSIRERGELTDEQRADLGAELSGMIGKPVLSWDGKPVGRVTDAEAMPYAGGLSIWFTVGPATPAPTVEGLLALKASLPPAEPERVVITPSLDALRAVVPFTQEPTLLRSPTDFRTTDGVRVVVTKYADRPRLFPACDLHLLGIGTAPWSDEPEADTPIEVRAAADGEVT